MLVPPFWGAFPKDGSWDVSSVPSPPVPGLRLDTPVEVFLSSLGSGRSLGLPSAGSQAALRQLCATSSPRVTRGRESEQDLPAAQAGWLGRGRRPVSEHRTRAGASGPSVGLASLRVSSVRDSKGLLPHPGTDFLPELLYFADLLQGWNRCVLLIVPCV